MCKIFFLILMGLLTLGFLRFTQYFRNQKKKEKKKIHEGYFAPSRLVNGLLVFLSEFFKIFSEPF